MKENCEEKKGEKQVGEEFYSRVGEAALLLHQKAYYIYRGFPKAVRDKYLSDRREVFIARLSPLILRYFDGDASKAEGAENEMRKLFDEAGKQEYSTSHSFDRSGLLGIDPTEEVSPEEEELLRKLQDRFVSILKDAEEKFAGKPPQIKRRHLQTYIDELLFQKSTEIALRLDWSEQKRGEVVYQVREILDATSDSFAKGELDLPRS